MSTTIPQSQPILPLTVSYPYGNNYNNNDNCNHYFNAIDTGISAVRSDLSRDTGYIRSDINTNSNSIKDNVYAGTSTIRSDLSRDTGNILSTMNQLSTAEVEALRNAQYDTRNALDRTNDNLNNNINNASLMNLSTTKDSSTQNLLASQNNTVAIMKAMSDQSTQNLLATQNTATSTQLGVQNSSADIKNNLQNNQNNLMMGQSNIAIQNEKLGAANILQTQRVSETALNAGRENQIDQYKIKADTDYKSLLETTSIKSQLCNQQNDWRHYTYDNNRHLDNQFLRLHDIHYINHGDNQRRAEYRQKEILLQNEKNTRDIMLQACHNKASLELQACENKAHLENQINITSANGILKTVESTALILNKLCECCCENKMMHNDSQKIIIQNSNQNQNLLLQNEINRLTGLLNINNNNNHNNNNNFTNLQIELDRERNNNHHTKNELLMSRLMMNQRSI